MNRIFMNKPFVFILFVLLISISLLAGLGGQSAAPSLAAPLMVDTSCFPQSPLASQRVGNSLLSDNFYGDHVLDFDGDGRTDVFTVDDQGNYKFSPAAKDPWQFLRNDIYPVEDLRFGDFDADGKTDLFKKTGSQWAFSSGGVEDWINLGSSNVALENLRFGQFDDDPRTDVFYRSASGDWLYSSGGNTVWASTGQNSGFPIDAFRFVDLDGNGKTDIFRVDDAGQFYVSYDAANSWDDIYAYLGRTISDIRFGYFDDQAGADVFLESVLQNWVYSSSGDSPFKTIGSATIPLDELRFGDFDNNGRTDLFTIGAAERWQVAFYFDAVTPAFKYQSPTVETDQGLLTCLSGNDSTSVNSSNPNLSDDGRFVTFNSRGNLQGQGPVYNHEIWLYDQETDDLRRMTYGLNGSDSSRFPKLSGDSKKIVFQSSEDFNSQGDTGILEIWMADVVSGNLERITTASDPTKSSNTPRTDYTGNRIVFLSNSDFLGQGIPLNGSEAWMYDRQAQVYTRLTTKSAPDRSVQVPVISPDGSKIVFISDSDFLNEGLPVGQRELWLYEVASGDLSRLTFGNPGRRAGSARFTMDGTQIVFSSDADYQADGDINASQNEVWHLNLVNGALTRITISMPSRSSNSPRITADGEAIIFNSDNDFLNEGLPDEKFEIWRYEVSSGQFTRLTYTPGSSSSYSPRMSGDGRFIAFNSSGDWVGNGGPSSIEIWLLDTNYVPPALGNNFIFLPFVTK